MLSLVPSSDREWEGFSDQSAASADQWHFNFTALFSELECDWTVTNILLSHFSKFQNFDIPYTLYILKTEQTNHNDYIMTKYLLSISTL